MGSPFPDVDELECILWDTEVRRDHPAGPREREVADASRFGQVFMLFMAAGLVFLLLLAVYFF